MSTVFEKIISGEFSGRFVWADDICVAFATIEPTSPGHVLVVPREPVPSWTGLDTSTCEHLMKVAQLIGRAQEVAFEVQRSGLVIAGFEVPHTHLHVIPLRQESDVLLSNAAPASDTELDEAMEVDGANVWTRYWRLAMPLAKPALATTVIFTFLATWDEFAWALTVISTETKRTLPIAIQLFHGQNSTQWGLVFAASLIAILPVIVVYLIFQRHFVAGLTAGAVKG